MAILPDLGIPADLVRTAKPNGAAGTSTPKAAKTTKPDTSAQPSPETVTLTRDELMALLAKAKAEVPQTDHKALSFKVSEKGALSVYGLRRFPITLYASEWARIIAVLPALQAFAAANQGALARRVSE